MEGINEVECVCNRGTPNGGKYVYIEGNIVIMYTWTYDLDILMYKDYLKDVLLIYKELLCN